MMQKQTITIPLGLGVNTKTDEKLVQAGEFNLVAENAVFDKVGAVKKRAALQAESDTYSRYTNGGVVTPAPSTLFADSFKPSVVSGYKDSLVLRNNKGEFYSKQSDTWIKYEAPTANPEYQFTEVTLTTSNEFIETDLDYNPTSKTLVATGIVANTSWIDCRLALYNTETKLVSLGYQEAVGATHCRSAWTRSNDVDTYYMIVTTSSNDLRYFRYDKNGNKIDSVVTIANIHNSSFAVCRSADNSEVYIIAPSTTSGSGRFIRINASGGISNVAFTHGLAVGWTSADCYLSNGNVTVVYTNGTNNRIIVLDTFGNVVTPNAVFDFSAPPVLSIGLDKDATGQAIVTAGTTSIDVYQRGLYSNQEAGLCDSITDVISLSGKKITGASFLDGISRTLYIGELSESSAAGVNLARRTAGFLYNQQLASMTTRRQTTRFAKVSETEAYLCVGAIVAESGAGLQGALKLLKIEIPSTSKGARSLVGPNLHFAGGHLAEYDGVRAFGNSFNYQPKTMTLSSSGAIGITGTYRYCYCYRYNDSNGQVTRSAPSPISTITVSSQRVDISLPTTGLGTNLTPATIEFYRTTNGGSIFYLIGEAVIEDIVGGVLTANDQRTDSLITSNPVLYTTGGVLANDPAPNCKFLTQGGNRLFAGGLLDENEIAYSKKKLFGESVSWSDFFRIRLDTAQFNVTGGVTALGYMDDKLIIFKENAIFYIQGDGPNELGQNDTFTLPELVSSDGGCTDYRSVVLTPFGLMFKSNKGIYLLDRALSLQYIGDAVEAYNSFNVVAATHLPNLNQVNFALSNGVILVFDYYTKQWSVIPVVAGLTDTDAKDGKLTILTATHVLVQTPGTFEDLTTAEYSAKVKTPWIKVSGIQDFGRIWSATILGKYKSAHNLIVRVYYDYDETTSTTYTIAPLSTDKQYQYKIHLGRQKCEAIQFEIFDQATGGSGESMELTALTLEVGVKSGSFKLPATRKY